jgi:hypothetical protein
MLKKVEETVTKALQYVPESRDDDQILCAVIWRKQIKHQIETMSAIEFLTKMSQGKFYKPESIMRCRRKLQELHKDLRGKKYDQRRKNTDQVKDELQTMDAESTSPGYCSGPIQGKLL